MSAPEPTTKLVDMSAAPDTQEDAVREPTVEVEEKPGQVEGKPGQVEGKPGQVEGKPGQVEGKAGQEGKPVEVEGKVGLKETAPTAGPGRLAPPKSAAAASAPPKPHSAAPSQSRRGWLAPLLAIALAVCALLLVRETQRATEMAARAETLGTALAEAQHELAAYDAHLGEVKQHVAGLSSQIGALQGLVDRGPVAQGAEPALQVTPSASPADPAPAPEAFAPETAVPSIEPILEAPSAATSDVSPAFEILEPVPAYEAPLTGDILLDDFNADWSATPDVFEVGDEGHGL